MKRLPHLPLTLPTSRTHARPLPPVVDEREGTA